MSTFFKWYEVAREEWEKDPSVTLSDIAMKYGRTPENVRERAKKEQWRKRSELGNINEVANLRADHCQIDDNGNFGSIKDAIDGRDTSEIMRTRVLVKMRNEWSQIDTYRQAALRALSMAAESNDRFDWLKAKTASDALLNNVRALSVMQDGIRRAWGLDVKSEEEIVIVNPRSLEDGSITIT